MASINYDFVTDSEFQSPLSYLGSTPTDDLGLGDPIQEFFTPQNKPEFIQESPLHQNSDDEDDEKENTNTLNLLVENSRPPSVRLSAKKATTLQTPDSQLKSRHTPQDYPPSEEKTTSKLATMEDVRRTIGMFQAKAKEQVTAIKEHVEYLQVWLWPR